MPTGLATLATFQCRSATPFTIRSIGAIPVLWTVSAMMRRRTIREGSKSTRFRLRACPSINPLCPHPAFGSLRPLLNRKILNVGRLRLRFCSIVATKIGLKIQRGPSKAYLRTSPCDLLRRNTEAYLQVPRLTEIWARFFRPFATLSRHPKIAASIRPDLSFL